MPSVPGAQRIRDDLENDIVEGRYAPGHRLDPAELSTRYGCSRTPVREALQALESTGLVEIRPKRGTYVAELSLSGLAERFEVMAELEGMAARLCAHRIEPAQLEQLESAHGECIRYAETADAAGYYYANATFHGLLYEASGNDYLRQQAAALKRQLQPYRRLQLRAPDRMRRSLSEHRAIIDAVADGESEAAEQAARDHVLVQVREFSQLIRTWDRIRAQPSPAGT